MLKWLVIRLKTALAIKKGDINRQISSVVFSETFLR